MSIYMKMDLEMNELFRSLKGGRRGFGLGCLGGRVMMMMVVMIIGEGNIRVDKRVARMICGWVDWSDDVMWILGLED